MQTVKSKFFYIAILFFKNISYNCGEILKKDFDYPDLSIVTTYDTCVINDVEYSNIKVERILRSYNENATLGTREDYPGNSDYCVVENDEGDGLQIYHSNAGCE